MRFTVNEKREIGGCEIPPLSLKYGPYLALPDGPEPPVLRLAPETERSGPLPANPSTAYQGGDWPQANQAIQQHESKCCIAVLPAAVGRQDFGRDRPGSRHTALTIGDSNHCWDPRHP